MAFCRFVFSILVVSVVSSLASNVPVFLWGDIPKYSIKSNPIARVTIGEFDGILKEELLNDPFTVIFMEETLSVEDFSSRNADGETSFPYLHANIGEAVYLPSVENALRVLNDLADPEKVDHIKLTENGLSAEIKPETGKFLFINLKDAREGESRVDLLRRHNDFMQKTFAQLKEKHERVVAIYTGHFPSWTVVESHSRVRRQANSNFSYHLEGLIFHADKITLTQKTSPINLPELSGNSSQFNEGATEQNTTLTFGEYSIVLHFNKKAGYWLFETVTIKNGEATEDLFLISDPSEVYALMGFSYECGQKITFGNYNNTQSYQLQFDSLKIQPFFQATNQTAFDDSFNCIGYFTVPIWSGLFVTFIFLLITFYGIMMMLDIRTMDRFDDPKGKTITINANE